MQTAGKLRRNRRERGVHEKKRSGASEGCPEAIRKEGLHGRRDAGENRAPVGRELQ